MAKKTVDSTVSATVAPGGRVLTALERKNKNNRRLMDPEMTLKRSFALPGRTLTGAELQAAIEALKNRR
jgi:hypothetical protein